VPPKGAAASKVLPRMVAAALFLVDVSL